MECTLCPTTASSVPTPYTDVTPMRKRDTVIELIHVFLRIIQKDRHFTVLATKCLSWGKVTSSPFLFLGVKRENKPSLFSCIHSPSRLSCSPCLLTLALATALPDHSDGPEKGLETEGKGLTSPTTAGV